MKSFIIRTVNVIAIVLILFGYHTVLAHREETEEAARLEYEEAVAFAKAYAALDGTEEAGDAQMQEETPMYADGVYAGQAQGFGGMITVSVTIEGDVLTDIEIVSADGEDSAYLTIAEGIIETILDAQSADVDTVSGATFSSTGIRDAVGAALEEALIF